MKGKIKKILRIMATIFAVLWIFVEIAFKESWEEPNLTVIIGVLIIWGIIIYSLREGKQVSEKTGISFCRNCGFELKENANFCTRCGERIKS